MPTTSVSVALPPSSTRVTSALPTIVRAMKDHNGTVPIFSEEGESLRVVFVVSSYATWQIVIGMPAIQRRRTMYEESTS